MRSSFSIIIICVCLALHAVSAGAEDQSSSDVLGEISGIENVDISSERCAEPPAAVSGCPEPILCPPCPEAASSDRGELDELAEADLEFFRKRVVAVLEEKRLDRDYAASLQAEFKNLAFMYRRLRSMAEVNFWISELYRREGEYEAMLVTLSRLIYLYPGSQYDERAREQIADLLSGRLKKHKKYDLGLLDGPARVPRAERFVKMLEIMSSFRERKYYPMVVEQCDEFLMDYPRHERADLVLTYKASSFVEMREYRSAALALERLAELYPESSIRSASLFELARLFADKLREYEKAAAAYEEIVSDYPDGPQTLSSYQNMAAVYEKRLKRHESAIRALEEIIRKYPGTPEALSSFEQMADIQGSTKDYKAAVETLGRLADMFKGNPSALDALERGAKIASGRLKYHELQITMLQRVADEYPDTDNAGDALYSIADTMEKRLGDAVGAVNVYKTLVEKYPGHRRASAAKKRVEKLLGQ